MIPLARPSHHPKRHLDRISRSSKIHGRYQRTDRQTDRTTTEIGPVAIASSLANAATRLIMVKMLVGPINIPIIFYKTGEHRHTVQSYGERK